MDLIYLLAEQDSLLCNQPGMKVIMGLVGYVILGVKIAVPIILIVIGMFDMAKAVTEQKEEKIKEAQTLLVKKAVAGVIVFLVATVVTLVMGLINAKEWEGCKPCLTKPASNECKLKDL